MNLYVHITEEEKQKERLYYFLWQIGSAYLLAPVTILAVLVFWKLITIVLSFEFQFENIRFNLPFFCAILHYLLYSQFMRYSSSIILFYPANLAGCWA